MAKGFTFKQFHVNDHGCGMPVSTDGVLLGAWAKLPPSAPHVPDLAGQDGKTATKNTVLDIGTGSGLLALMAAQRTTEHTTVTAIELDAGAALAAQHNFADSPWSSRLTLVNADVQTWATAQPAGAYPAIVCNPPYFNHGEQADCQARATARHTDSLTHQALLTALRHLLAPEGTASLILPDYEGRQFIAMAEAFKLHCRRVCEVRTTGSKPVSRLLIALSPTAGTCLNEQLVIHHQGSYSADFIALTQAFYLKM